MPVLQNAKDRALGREDGAHGKPSKCPAHADAWSYRSGFIEGCAARDAEIADNDLKAFEAKIAKEQEELFFAQFTQPYQPSPKGHPQLG